MKKVMQKKVIDGYEVVNYLYECKDCEFNYWAETKNLFMSCPKCREELELAL
tara:strand:- start:3106 stop:3261 length:156 start_codon:yes stop_codon:yes gene_type:complete